MNGTPRADRRRAPAPAHTDAGLQPERTALAWGRSMLAMVVAGSLFLRWVPHYGLFAAAMCMLSLLTAAAISLGHRVRYYRAVHGISHGVLHADVVGVVATGAAVALLAAVGIVAVVLLPLGG